MFSQILEEQRQELYRYLNDQASRIDSSHAKQAMLFEHFKERIERHEHTVAFKIDEIRKQISEIGSLSLNTSQVRKGSV